MNSLKSPRPHQLVAIENATKHYWNFDRGQLHMACGTGKTLTSLWIAKSLKAHKIVIILPSLQLQEQSLNIWMEEAKFFDFDLLAVGSDKSFSKKYNVTTTTNVSEIQKFLLEVGPKIIFSTYQSYDKLLEACSENQTFDFAIIDESHNTAGHNEKKFSRLLFEPQNLPIKKMLFMTGTPKFFDDGVFVSMDNENLFGKVIYNLSTEDAIKKNILSNYKILVMYISEKELINQENISQPITINDSSVPLNYLALKFYVEKAVAQYGIKKLLSFHNSKVRANKFAKILNGDIIKTYSVNCTQNINKRIEIVEKYKNDEVSCICNPRIMIEGFDLPQIDSILFSDIKNSKQDISQAIGRALRKFPHKNLSYILLPIFINEGGIINKKDYNIYSELLASVALSDGRVYNYFNYGENINSNIEIIDSINFTESQINQFHEAISIRVWKKIKPTNFITYKEFKALIKSQNITSVNQYFIFFDKCSGIIETNMLIPKRPNRFYKEWESWFEIFGYQTEPIIAYNEFKALMLTKYKKAGINSSKKYFAWAYSKTDFGVEFPKNFPRYPTSYYKEWISWYDLFNTKKKEILDFKGFKKEIIKYKSLFNSNFEKEYILWGRGELNTNIKFPENFPVTPSKKYIGWEGWLKLFNQKKKKIIDFTSFKEQITHYKEKHKIDSARKYFNWAKNKEYLNVPFPENFPNSPANAYKNKWGGWSEIFNKKRPNYLEFKKEVLNYFAQYPLKNGGDYLKWSQGKLDIGIKFPDSLPRYPNEYYPEWEGWQKILNTRSIFLNYTEFINSLGFYKRNYGISSSSKYLKWHKNITNFGVEFPSFFPKYPDTFYKEWEGWKKAFGN